MEMTTQEARLLTRDRFARNVLVVGGLLFFYGVIGSPVTYVWGRAFVEGRVFNNTSGALLFSMLSLVPQCLVAAGLGWALPRYVQSSRTREWALAFALYLGVWYYFKFRWSQPELTDSLIHISAAFFLGAAAFAGYFISSRRRLDPHGGGAV
jgi:hypothetical protein